MRKLILYIILLFITHIVNAQIPFIKVEVIHLKVQGFHDPMTMYYRLSEWKAIIQRIDSVKQLEESDIFSLWGLPIIDKEGASDFNCDSAISPETLFNKNIIRKVVKTEDFEIVLTFSAVDANVREFPLYYKYWGDYPIAPIRVGVVSYPFVINCFRKKEKIYIDRICKSLAKK